MSETPGDMPEYTRDTIAAIATPPGKGGIGIVRVSGDDAGRIAHAMLGELPDPRTATHAAFLDADGELVLAAERVANNASHGTGCPLASAVAALLARGRTPREAALEAKEFVRRGIEDAVQLGRGQSNLHLLWEYYGREGLP